MSSIARKLEISNKLREIDRCIHKLRKQIWDLEEQKIRLLDEYTEPNLPNLNKENKTWES